MSRWQTIGLLTRGEGFPVGTTGVAELGGGVIREGYFEPPEVRGFGEAPVFRQIDEKPWTVPALQSAFERILRRSGLQPAHGRPTPHSIRHTASTWAVRGGATPDEADRLRGITMKGMAAVYTHLQAADLLRAARALPAVEAEGLAVVRAVEERS